MYQHGKSYFYSHTVKNPYHEGQRGKTIGALEALPAVSGFAGPAGFGLLLAIFGTMALTNPALALVPIFYAALAFAGRYGSPKAANALRNRDPKSIELPTSYCASFMDSASQNLSLMVEEDRAKLRELWDAMLYEAREAPRATTTFEFLESSCEAIQNLREEGEKMEDWVKKNSSDPKVATVPERYRTAEASTRALESVLHEVEILRSVRSELNA